MRFNDIASSFAGLIATITSFKLYKGLIASGNKWVSSTKANINDLKSEYRTYFKELDALQKKYSTSFSLNKDANTGMLSMKMSSGISGSGPSIPTDKLAEANTLLDKCNAATKQINANEKELAATTGLWGKAVNGIAIGFENLVTAVLSIAKATIWSAIIGFLTKIGVLIKDIIQDSKRLKNLKEDLLIVMN